MKTIIVSDIFGKTAALERLAAALPGEVSIFDPYDSVFMGFENEDSAYAHFCKSLGHDSYAERLKEFIRAQRTDVFLIGFSVGAAAIWSVSVEKTVLNVQKAVCYYGSQIRNNVDVVPNFPIDLVFPSVEAHFSVEDLMQKLAGKSHVSMRQVPYLHGFMNELSVNYNRRGYTQEVQSLCKWS